ncbi:MAG: hybrid sensor histidine kinase/response regulator, partial [Scytonema sp. PMC 1069.18]|nr:hybrid sensor histidine kinase/response regulator [Scytonema sp. PMC 1069.18]
MTMYEQSYNYFLQEAEELLQVIEQELFSLREGFSINKVYTLMRATHTLKGAAASIGLETITTLVHSLEDIFRTICQPDLSIDTEVEALLFEGYECLYLALSAEHTGNPINDGEMIHRMSAILTQLQEKLGNYQEGYIPNSEDLGFDLTQSIFELGVTQRLEHLTMVIASANPEQVASTLKTQAEVFVGLGESLNLPGFQAIAQAVLIALENYPNQVLTIARLALANFTEAKTEVLNGDRTQGSQLSAALQQLTIPPQPQTPPPPRPSSTTVRVNVEHLEQLNYFIGELLTNQNRQFLENEQLRAAVRVLTARLQKHQQVLNQLQDWSGPSDLEWNDNIETAYIRRYTQIEQRNICVHPRASAVPNLFQSLLEDSVQLGEATDAVEMFTRQSQETLEKQRRLLTNTRDALMEARMLPLEHLFERFPWILEKLEFVHKKQVNLEFCGGETLVDKVVVEKLYEPLLHLIRNAFDHGIESPNVRQEWGKPEKGLIQIKAYYQGRYLVVEVQDDGQGLDYEKIRAKAIESELVSPIMANNLSRSQLQDFLFEPGFSTSSVVNDLSGRGIGLDVVRTHLHAIKGSVSVDSELHQGTMFKIQIPLSLTIAKLLLCQAGDRIYALFANAIEEILIPTPDQIRSWEGGKVLRWGQGAAEKLIPVYQLTTALNYFSPVTQLERSLIAKEIKITPIILIRSQDKLVGLEVEQFLGDQELVIRPLGAMIVPPSYVYGGSILADGRLTLVLDATALVEYLFNRKTYESTDSDLVSWTPLIPTPRPQQPKLLTQSRAALPTSPHTSVREKPNTTILLVDDSITVRQTLALTLEKAGYRVVLAKDGYEAIEQIQNQANIQLIFCDIEMPRMNGFEFLKYRQQDSMLTDIPVVMLTSKSSDKHRTLAFNLGANAYITKPYLEHMLLTTLTDILQKNHQ